MLAVPCLFLGMNELMAVVETDCYYSRVGIIGPNGAGISFKFHGISVN